jgi:hypothetical protein
VVGVTAVAVALVRVSLVARVRPLLGVVPRVGGAILLGSGLYVAYYGRYELRLARDLRLAGRDPLVAAAGDVQRWLSNLVGAVGAVPLTVLLAVLVLVPVLLARRARTLPPDGSSGAPTRPAAAGPTSPVRTVPGLRRRAGTR